MAEKFNEVGDIIEHPKFGKGTFIVVKTAYTGGGTGHGPHDVYPDGHLLKLLPCRVVKGMKSGIVKRVDIANDHKPLEFYQSGCFTHTVMVDYVKPILKVKVQYAAALN